MVWIGMVGTLGRLGELMVVVSGKGLWREGILFIALSFWMSVRALGSSFGMTIGVAMVR